MVRIANASPKEWSALYMAIASAIHFAGYELAKNSVLTMMTSERTGFSTSTVQFATGCIGPFALGLLWLYNNILEHGGPRKALVYSTCVCASMLTVGGFILLAIDDYIDDESKKIFHDISKLSLWLMFVLLSGFVYLLYTQHWSFLGSINIDRSLFPPIAGIGSVSSTLSALSVSSLVVFFGLTRTLLLGGFLIFISAYFADGAYRIAQKNGFEPHKTESTSTNTSNKSIGKEEPLLTKARKLFSRVPILGSLCIEVLISQFLSSLINFLFIMQVKAIAEDDSRAALTGNVYASINATSGVLQFFVLPIIMDSFNPTRIWIFMPCTMLGCTALMTLEKNTMLQLTIMSFFILKTMEYSLRGVATELVYVNLDYDSRYLGKEIISLFANRFGKSGIGIAVSALTSSQDDPQKNHRQIVFASNVVAVIWLFASYRLSRQIGTMPKLKDK